MTALTTMPNVVDIDLAQRTEFSLPTNRDVDATGLGEEEQDMPCTYLCGNSLGALPKRAEALVREEFQVWGTRAVEGHFSHPKGRPWLNMTDHINPLLAELLGAKESEVACMGTLTANLHLMMNTFYKPTPTRYKIMCEVKAFPSDQYTFTSQAMLHGLDPRTAIVELAPRPGEFTLREEDMLAAIEREGASVALVIFPAVQYYTGQWFPMEAVTRAAKQHGCICAWDLAHGTGNVPMSLHDWGVDFAVWCSYKYLNSGPGGIGGLYVHEKWEDIEKPKMAGWWGHDPATRFAMPPNFVPIRGAQGFQQSNPSVFALAALLGSLQVFQAAGMMPAVRKQSVVLTGHLAKLLSRSRHFVDPADVHTRNPASGSERAAFTIITPDAPEARGAQLSLLFSPAESGVMHKVYIGLKRYGVIGDERQPDVIRLAPAALYNTIDDCERAAMYLERVLDELDERV